MYEQYYGLSEKPFSLTPDTEFFYQSFTHQEALNVLLVAIKAATKPITYAINKIP